MNGQAAKHQQCSLSPKHQARFGHTNPNTSHWECTWIHVQTLQGAGHCWLWNCVLEELAPFQFLRNITWPEMLWDGNPSSPSPPASTAASFSAFLQEKELHRSFLGSGTHLPFSLFFFLFFFGVFHFIFTWSVPIAVIKDKARHQQLLLYDLNDIFMLHHMG